ncbi:hypothetical protein BCR42DRAFT_492048 [Absidia repens]|uniref:PH domain-containing protein n=1 Tax=Absidia repens TaxID=90262 RepID=A0A1X2IFY6_9FUNG|nr:hypothetical protein BCR42DRAFT_492048 [Absidia repens]
MTDYPVVRNPLLPSPPPPPSHRFRMLQQLSHPTPSIKSSLSTLSLKNIVNKSFQRISQAGHHRTTKRIAPAMIKTHDLHKFNKPDDTTDDFYYAKKGPVIDNDNDDDDDDDEAEDERDLENNLTPSHHRHIHKSMSTFSFMSFKKKPPTKSISTNMIKKMEPVVHYNGAHHTLEQLPDEKWQWIKHPSLAESQQGLQNPLANCATSIVFRKPHRPFSPLTSPTEPKEMKPKATFYLRARLFRCGVQIHEETCMSAYTASEKCGKNSVQANLDETFLFDVDESCNATLSIYSQQRAGVQLFYPRAQQQNQDIRVGQHQFQIHLSPTQKHVQRQVITDHSNGQSYQVLVVFGVYVSHRSQTMINNSKLMEDYLTMQVRGTFTPRLERFWVVVRGVQLELYDFDFRETRPPLHIIPLHTLIEAYHGNAEEQDEQPIGAGGLTLQFSEHTLDPAYRRSILDHPEFECRMYVLAENMERSKQWEQVLNYMVSIFDECREETELDSIGDSIGEDDEDDDDDDDDYGLYGDDIYADLASGGTSQKNEKNSEDEEDEEEVKYYSQYDFLKSPSFPQYKKQQQQQCSIVPTKFLW